MSQFFSSGGQNIGTSASASVSLMNIQGRFPLKLTGLTLCSPRDFKSLLQLHNLKASVGQCSAFFMVQILHSYMTNGKTIPLTRRTFVDKLMYLLFSMLSMLVIAFLPRNKHLFNFMVAVTIILEPKKIKSITVSIPPPPSICYEGIGPDTLIFGFEF